jgi:hypothetical protein
MFDLERSIAEWREQMSSAGIKAPAPLEELENHLREEIERQIPSGLPPHQAFEMAAEQFGPARPLKTEFKKIDAENWNRPLAWSAWTLFLVSFFLPALGDGFGWQCAGLSATAVSWPEFGHNWTTIHLASLTLANLLMIVSPFWLARFSHNPHSIKWLRLLSLAAVVLVWSFLLLLITHADRAELKIGCYVWGLSFFPLWLSTLRIWSRKMSQAKYV